MNWEMAAASARLCVETLLSEMSSMPFQLQPPSGGCVFKHHAIGGFGQRMGAATFVRLCIETMAICFLLIPRCPQSPSRGCVFK